MAVGTGFQLFILLLIVMCMANHRIVAWNMGGFRGGKHYLLELVKEYDIVALSEHWLYPQEADLVKDFLPTDFDLEV